MQAILDKLKVFDDPNFVFEPIEHKYTLNGEYYISCTQYLQKFHLEFDSKYWSAVKAEQRGITQEEILLEWKQKNDRANVIGTAMHNYFENYFNKIYQPIPLDLDVVDRINKFNVIFVNFLYKLIPIKFEQRIFSRKYKIAGMMDALFEYNNNVFIFDYKSNGDLTTDDHPKGKYEKMLYPFQDYWKNHLNEYSIQLSLYKLILKEADIDIKAGYLIYIGPNEPAKIYKTHDFSDILEKYLDEQNNK